MKDKVFEYFESELKTALAFVLVTALGLSLGIDAVQRKNIADAVLLFVGLTGLQAYLVYKWSYYHTLASIAASELLSDAQRQLAAYEAKYGKN